MAPSVRRTSATTTPTRADADVSISSPSHGEGRYVLPIVGASVPAPAVELGFWGGLAGAAVLGAIDPPLAILLGAGVVVARHRRR